MTLKRLVGFWRRHRRLGPCAEHAAIVAIVFLLMILMEAGR